MNGSGICVHRVEISAHTTQTGIKYCDVRVAVYARDPLGAKGASDKGIDPVLESSRRFFQVFAGDVQPILYVPVSVGAYEPQSCIAGVGSSGRNVRQPKGIPPPFGVDRLARVDDCRDWVVGFDNERPGQLVKVRTRRRREKFAGYPGVVPRGPSLRRSPCNSRARGRCGSLSDRFGRAELLIGRDHCGRGRRRVSPQTTCGCRVWGTADDNRRGDRQWKAQVPPPPWTKDGFHRVQDSLRAADSTHQVTGSQAPAGLGRTERGDLPVPMLQRTGQI